MKPRCHNRAPYSEGRWLRVGVHPRSLKPVYRWFPRWFVDRCVVWDGVGIGPIPGKDRYPQHHKFDCTGCVWLPKEYQREAEEAAAAVASA